MAAEIVTKEQTEFFDRNGWLLTTPFDADRVAAIRSWVDEVAGWPDAPGGSGTQSGNGWLHYREKTVHGPRLCRTENFIPHHEGLRSLLTSGALVETASALLGEPAVLYKEKINYKLAGGAGYAPHQDAPAYRFVDVHVSCMIAIDDSRIENGCLEVVSAMHRELLDVDDRGCIAPEIVARMEWQPVEVRAGEVLWFHSLAPHRSGPNTSPDDRRAIYPTYNARREGDLREAYYAQKLAEFAAAPADGTRVQVSLIGDFEGTPA